MMLRKKSRENLKMFWMLWDYGFVKYFIFIFTVPVLPAGMEEWYLNPHGSSTKLLSVAACGASYGVPLSLIAGKVAKEASSLPGSLVCSVCSS